jgi:hypothetical protein
VRPRADIGTVDTGLSIGDDLDTIDQLENILHKNRSFNDAALTLAQEEIFAELNRPAPEGASTTGERNCDRDV